jgi:sigma-B regulation protein RsbU (phosphoserine phosphatase)
MGSTGGETGAPPAGVEALYEDAPCGLLLTAPDGLIRRANRTFCTWVDHRAETLIGRVKIQDLLTMGGRIYLQTHWQPLLLMQGSVMEVKLDILRRDGRSLPVVLNAVRRAHQGAVFHELALFTAEDRHRYEQELMAARQRAEELLANEQAAREDLAVVQRERDRQQTVAEDRALFAEQMMAIVSHDLRNPLSVIGMNAHIVKLGEMSLDQQRAIERVERATARATRLIADLLDFSQARLGKGLQVDFKPFDLHRMAAESVEDLRVAHPQHTILHQPSGSGACVASHDRLVQVIGNLVANAVAYGDPARPVVVATSIEEQTFSIAVCNQGKVIPQALIPTLFDPMTRGKETENAERSVGLGLFIVREIVRAHGATIAVTSSNGDGTIFKGNFPRIAK